MRHLFAFVAALMLGACNGAVGSDSDTHHGRYQGIGVFDAGQGWKAMVGTDKPTGKRASFRQDDHIIVVVDSSSGEVRQCGDHSGYCVAMNPWARAVPPSQQLPVELAPISDSTERNAAEPASNLSE